LGIWRSGRVEFWGTVENRSAASMNIRKDYLRQPFAKMHLGVGLYLLDLRQIEKNRLNGKYSYLVVVAVCRNTLENKKFISYLKVTNGMNLEKFEKIISDKELSGNFAPSSLYRVYKERSAFIDFIGKH
jgi:hypothetical protein